jgi:hypothetical protein
MPRTWFDPNAPLAAHQFKTRQVGEKLPEKVGRFTHGADVDIAVALATIRAVNVGRLMTFAPRPSNSWPVTAFAEVVPDV